MGLPELMGGVLLLSLIVYALMAGADFGGGVWDLFAWGRRGPGQRRTIARAVGPIWEANHVWMIVAVVVLFTAFPPAFALIMTALHVPVAIMLVGIVLRGSSFVFRKYDPAGVGEAAPSRWGRVFAVSSVATPVMLGVILGTLSTPALGSGDLPYSGSFFEPWLAPFPWAVGFFALALFSFEAATYLTVESDDSVLADDFRLRALLAAAAVAVTGSVAFVLGREAAPELRTLESGWGAAVPVAGAIFLGGAVRALWSRSFIHARFLAGSTTVTVLVGWGAAQAPWLVSDALTVRDAAAPEATLRLITAVLAGGALVLVPAFVYLYRTFKGGLIFASMERDEEPGPEA